jgi:hypothetical protein
MVVIAVICGALLARRFRTPAMLAASLALALVATFASLAIGEPLLRATLTGIAALVALQVAYLVTLAIPAGLSAVRKSRSG